MSAGSPTSPVTLMTLPFAPACTSFTACVERLAPARGDGDVGARARESHRDGVAEAL